MFSGELWYEGGIACDIRVVDVVVENQFEPRPTAVKIALYVIGAWAVVSRAGGLPVVKLRPRNPLMSLRKSDNPESGLSLLQGLTILAIIGVIATVIFSSLGG